MVRLVSSGNRLPRGPPLGWRKYVKFGAAERVPCAALNAGRNRGAAAALVHGDSLLIPVVRASRLHTTNSCRRDACITGGKPRSDLLGISPHFWYADSLASKPTP